MHNLQTKESKSDLRLKQSKIRGNARDRTPVTRENAQEYQL